MKPVSKCIQLVYNNPEWPEGKSLTVGKLRTRLAPLALVPEVGEREAN